MRKPTNKANAVLGVLRDLGELTCHQIAEAIQERTPCGVCDGTGEGSDDRWGCRPCYGRGHVVFGYSDAYVCLKQLHAHGLITRRLTRNEWGDEGTPYVYSAVSVAPGDDPLEALFAAPAAEETSG